MKWLRYQNINHISRKPARYGGFALTVTSGLSMLHQRLVRRARRWLRSHPNASRFILGLSLSRSGYGSRPSRYHSPLGAADHLSHFFDLLV